MRLLWIISGLYWCAVKGIKMFIFGKVPADKSSMPRNDWGWSDPAIDYVWEEQTTLPRGGKSHHRPDIIVEWNRLDAQRGAKLLCGLAAWTFVLGFLMGASLAFI